MSSPHLTPKTPGETDVLVAGAGLAGLAAADCLRRAGRRPLVIEATDRAGGRLRSRRLAGQVFEEGAVFFGNNYKALRSYLRETGLDADRVRYGIHGIASLPSGTTLPTSVSGFVKTRSMPIAEKLAFMRFGAKWLPLLHRIQTSLDGSATSQRLRHLDDVGAADFFRREVGPEFVDRITDPFLESLGFAPTCDWSAYGALQVLQFAVRPSVHGLAHGNDRLAQALADNTDVRYGRRVVAIAPDAAGVSVETEDANTGSRSDRIYCRDLILAMPAPHARQLLSGELGEAVDEFRYSASVVVAVAVEHIDIDIPALSFFDRERICGLAATRVDPDGPIVCYAALGFPLQYELFDAPDDELIAFLTDRLGKVSGDPVRVLEGCVVRWRNSVPITEPGALERRARVRALAGELPHLALGGDWLASPSLEGALVSGRLAAESLLDR